MKKNYFLKLVMSVLLIVTSIQIGVAQDTTPPTVVAQDFTAKLDVTGNVTVSQSDIISSITDDVTSNPTVTLSNTTFNCNDIIKTGWEHKNTSISGNYEKSAFYSDVSGIYMVGYKVSSSKVDLLKWNASDWEVMSTLESELTPNFLNLSRHSNGTFLINFIDQNYTLYLFGYDSGTTTWSELISATVNPQWNFSDTDTYDIANFATNPINGDIWMSFVPANSDGGTYAPNILKYNGTTLSFVGYPGAGITDEWSSNCDITFTADGNAHVIFGARNNPVGPFVISYNGTTWNSRGIINGIQGQNFNNNIITSDTNEVFISFRDATTNLSHLIKTSDFVTWENLWSAPASHITSLSKLSAGKIYYRFSNNGYLVDGLSVVDITEPEYDTLINAKLVLNPQGEYLLFGNYNYASTRTYKYINNKTISYVVTDEAGNKTSGSVAITVEDNLAPTVITQNISVSLDATGNVSILPAAIDNNSTDACGINAYTLNITDFTCANLGVNTVTLSVSDKNGNSTSADATVTVLPGDLVPVTTSEFGNNEWKVYAYTNTPTYCIPYTNYEGYYTETNLSFDTTSRWGSNNSPSDASGYIGNSVPSDNHAYSAKRKGFPAAYYSIDIPGHDDDATLFVNGVEVFKHLGCCDEHYKVWEGVLDTNSTVEYRILEGGGGSYGAITFNIVPLKISAVVANFSSSSCETTVTVSGTGGTPPYTGEGVFTVGSGTYNYSIFDSLGTEVTTSVTVTDNSKPVVTTKNISVTLDTNGQAIVTPAMVDNSSTDNCSITSYQVATGTPVSPKIYFTGTNRVIWSANRDGSGVPTPLYDYHDDNMRTSIGIEINLDNSNLYFASGSYRNIYNATLDGIGTLNTIPNTSAQSRQHDLEIDWEADKLFFTDSRNGVYVTNIDGSSPKVQIGTSGAVAMTYDKTNQKIYYVNPNGSIGVVDADGENENTELFSADSPRGITIDETAGRLFWVEKDSKEIYTALVDGSEAPHVLYSFAVDDTFVNNGYGIDFEPNTNTLFWTAFGYDFDETVYSAPADGSGVPKILYKGSFGNIRGIAAGRNIHGTALNTTANDITYSAKDVGTQTLYLVVTDAAGNKSIAPATITVLASENMGPEIICSSNVSQNVDADLCTASVVTQDLQITNSEAVSSVTWTMTGATVAVSPISGINYVGTTAFNSGITTITYTAKDALNNISTCSFTVTVTDNVLPVALTKNITVSLDINGQATLLPSQINDGSTDNCQIESYKLLTGTSLSPKIYFTGANGVIWSANRDGSGIPTRLYDYRDENMNTAVGIQVNLDNNNLYFAGAYDNNIYNATLDGIGTINTIPNTYPGGNQHDLEIDWEANKLFYTDSDDGVYVTTIDGSEPATQIGTDRAVALTYDKTNQKIYYVNPNGSIGVVDTDGSNENTELFSANDPRGITIDEAAGRLFWVELNSKEIYTALVDGSEAPHVLYSFAVDNDYVEYAYGIDFDPNTNTLFWTAFGNRYDNTIYTAPADGSGIPQVLFVGDYGYIRGIAAGRNIHGKSLTEYANSINYTASDIGIHTETLVITDANGNKSTAEAIVTVITGPFSISCPENIAKSTDTGVCTASIVVENPIVSDLEDLRTLTWNMTGATIGNSEAAGINYVGTVTFNSGVTTITYTATDSNETVVECSFTVTVTDTESPIGITKNITITLDLNGQTTLIPSQIENISTDNCGITSYELTKASALSPFIYFTGVTDGKIWKANRDGSGTPILLNAASAGAAGIEVNYDNGKIYYATSTTNKIQTQPLSGLGVSVAVPDTDQGNNKHDFEYDWAGNRIFYTTNSGGIYVKSIDGLSTPIQLVDDAQVVTLTFDKTNQKIYYGNLSGYIGVVNADGTGKNNTLFVASPKGITINEATGRLFWVEQSLKKIYTALIDGTETPHELYSTGAAGNPFGIDYDPTTDSLYWTVFNSGEKIVSAPASGVGTPVTLFNGSYGGLRGIAAGRNIKGNDLSSATSSLAFDCSNIGDNIVYLIVKDAAGNTSSTPATVKIADTTLPNAIAQDLQVQLDSFGNATITADEIDNGSTDNCSVSTISLSQYTFTISDVGTKTITLTITDSSGNESTATSQVTVNGSLGISNLKNNLFVIYPVPFENFINITLPDSYTEDVVYIQVIDQRGRIIYDKKQPISNKNVSINDLAKYSDGGYFITLSDAQQKLIQTKQILKKTK